LGERESQEKKHLEQSFFKGRQAILDQVAQAQRGNSLDGLKENRLFADSKDLADTELLSGKDQSTQNPAHDKYKRIFQFSE
jgi:hypothetical protein